MNKNTINLLSRYWQLISYIEEILLNESVTQEEVVALETEMEAIEASLKGTRYYISSPQNYEHDCVDAAIYLDNGDGTARCVAVTNCTSCPSVGHGQNHEHAQIGDMMSVSSMVLIDCMEVLEDEQEEDTPCHDYSHGCSNCGICGK